MKRVFKKIAGITGSRGALGSELINKYKTHYDFRIYTKRIENISDLNTWINKNRDIEIFIHLAAISTINKSNKDKKKAFKINFESTKNIINLLKKVKLNNLKYFLFASSSHVYKPSFLKLSENSPKQPTTIYGKTKKKTEDFIFKNRKKLYFKIGIARIFNFYSLKHEKGFFIYDIKKKLIGKKKTKLIKKINTNRDYSNVYQICEILHFMINRKIEKALNVGSGYSLNLIDLIRLIKKKFNYKKDFTYEKKNYPGFIANINLLKSLGFKKKIKKFRI